ncbi:MAG: 50S ribosomal protein L29 [Bacilli bacterium]|jgi:large subunit ribosomal protein L29|nr:50S ribosomal protein L29 [Bacilli bacterium]
MKIKEVRDLSTEELNARVYSLKEELYNLRRKKAVGQLENMMEIKRVRKDIAKVLTVLRERELGLVEEGK